MDRLLQPSLASVFSDPPVLIVTGHYGVGKTNVSLNIVRELCSAGHSVTLIDLDIVNPYFRSSDNLAFLQSQGVTLLGPVYATHATNLDTPSLQPGIDEAIGTAGARKVVIDVGGDPDGARALARYRNSIIANKYQMLFVANFSRPEVSSASLAYQCLRQIEETSGLSTTGVFGNTHLMSDTSPEVILTAAQMTQELAERAKLDLIGVGSSRVYYREVLAGLEHEGFSGALYPIDKIVVTPWG